MLDPWRHLQGSPLLADARARWDERMEIAASSEGLPGP